MRSTAAPLVAVLAAAFAAGVASQGGDTTIFYDDFATCKGVPDETKWSVSQRQWGCSNCNGGVVKENVGCSFDSKLNKNVLTLTANGDLYTGSGPNGIHRHGAPRTPTDEFTGWAWPLYHPSCAPYCNVRRVGGSVYTNQMFGGTGSNLTIEWHVKPCEHVGAATAMWMFYYKEHYCDVRVNTCDPAYTLQCCEANPCSIQNDVCDGTWIENDEIDFELPTASAPYNDPAYINFNNIRYTSLTALPSGKGFQCGVQVPCQNQSYVKTDINQNDGNYHLYTLRWEPPTDTFEGYVSYSMDGNLQREFRGRNVVPTNGTLWMAAWFPNAWAGSPNFTTCDMKVDYVKVTSDVPQA